MMRPETLSGDDPETARHEIPHHTVGSEGDDAPLSIGLVSPAWPPESFLNGIISYAASATEGLRASGHRTTILAGTVLPGIRYGDDSVYDFRSSHLAENPVRRALEGIGHRVAPLWMAHRNYINGLSVAVHRGIAERGMQLLEMEESFGLAGRLQRLIPIPICVRLHGPWFLNGAAQGVTEDARFRSRVAKEGRALKRALAVTSPSRDVLEQTREFYGLPLEQAEVIPNPIDPILAADRWRLEGCDPRQILFVGRFDRHKGADLIIEAFGRVLEVMPDARLCFVGPDQGDYVEGGRRWDLEGFVDDRLPGARASGRIRLMGRVPSSDLAGLRRNALVSVVCSRYENFPYAAIEAMAMGCPLVASRVGGIPEIVQDDIDGLLHRNGDPADLAAKIVAMLADPARAADFGRNAAARCAREFHPIAIASRTVDYYRQILRMTSTKLNRRPQLGPV